MKTALHKLLLAGLMLLLVLKVAGCATGAAATRRESRRAPSPGEQADPEFWRMWQDQRGLGGLKIPAPGSPEHQP